MRRERIDELIGSYRTALLDDVVPFWTRHAIDREAGGYLGCLDQDGRVFSTDKAVALQARTLWMFARLYNTVEPRAEWLELARHGADFLLAHGFDSAGRMLFVVDRAGRPRVRTRSPNGLSFAIQGLAELGIATGDTWLRDRAVALHGQWLAENRRLERRLFPRPGVRSLSARMLQLMLAPTLRRIDDRPANQAFLERCIEELLTDFYRAEPGIVLERLSRKGRPIGAISRQQICPGHGIEVAWFLLDEARSRGDDNLVERALPLLAWSLEKGWDAEHGGIFLTTDPQGRPLPDAAAPKQSWPQAEALCALLLAYAITGDSQWESGFERLHAYVEAHFRDTEHGEWFGYLDREGRPVPGFARQGRGPRPRAAVKGDLQKSIYHTGRCLLACWRLLEWLKAGAPAGGLAQELR